MPLRSINPATGKEIAAYDEMSAKAVQTIIANTHAAFLDWRKTDFVHRARKLEKVATLLRNNCEQYAKLMSDEMGKPITQGRAEVEKCAWACDYYAEHGAAFLAAESIETDASNSFVTYQPLGVVLAVMPWNFPFWQVFRFAAPGLMAGNGAVLKHSSNVSGCALAIEAILQEAGFPTDLFRTLLISSGKVADVLENPLVKAATLTGSTAAGQAVAQKAGAMLKKTVLELGGSDPYVVLADADIAAAAETCVNSRLINSGQSCIAAKRFIVVDAVYDEFVERFVAQMKRAIVGDPLNEATTVGPQARKELRDELHEQVQQSVAQGSRCLLGGEIPAGDGAFYPPTVLVDIPKDAPAYREELFGPVAAIMRVADEEGAIQVANDSSFGLGAALFTRDLAKGERIATYELDAGCCFVNALVKSDPRLPFGGIKESGYGRELSYFGIREFVNIKSVYVK